VNEVDRSRRVVVTSPRARTTRPAHRGALDLDEQTTVGEVYLRSLVRTQLGLALTVCLAVLVVVAGLPLLFDLWPSTRHARLLGLGVPWLALGVLAYPALVIGGWAYVRAAERNEGQFAALVQGRSEEPSSEEP
jgi:drug/metabolite transporter (DMT)-like permease